MHTDGFALQCNHSQNHNPYSNGKKIWNSWGREIPGAATRVVIEPRLCSLVLANWSFKEVRLWFLQPRFWLCHVAMCTVVIGSSSKLAIASHCSCTQVSSDSKVGSSKLLQCVSHVCCTDAFFASLTLHRSVTFKQVPVSRWCRHWQQVTVTLRVFTTFHF